METLTRTWPRKVAISVGFGAGLSTWWNLEPDIRYGIVEHPETITAAELGETWEQLQDRLIAAGYDRKLVEDLYGSGWKDVWVIEVNGPYIIREHDGAETVEERDFTEWRM